MGNNKGYSVDNGFDIHYALRYPVQYALTQSDDVMEEVKDIYYANESYYKDIIKTLDIDAITFYGTQSEIKWNMLMLDSIITDIENTKGEEESLTFIRKLIRKSFNRIANFAELNPVFNLNTFVQYIENREPNVSNDFLSMYINLYLYFCKDLPDFVFKLTPLANVTIENLNLSNVPMDVLESNFMLDSSLEKEALEFYKELTGKKWKGKDDILIKNIFTDIELDAVDKNKDIKNRITRTGNTRLAYTLPILNVLRHDLSVINMLGFDNTFIFMNVTVSKSEWFKLYKALQMGYETKNLEPRDMKEMMVHQLLLFGLGKIYKHLDKSYLELNISSSKSDILLQAIYLNEKEHQLRIKEEELKKREEQLLKKQEEMEIKFQQQLVAKDEVITDLYADNIKLQEKTKLLNSLQEELFR